MSQLEETAVQLVKYVEQNRDDLEMLDPMVVVYVDAVKAALTADPPDIR